MLKKILHKLRQFWWAGLSETASWYSTDIYTFTKERRQRNNEENIYKRRMENPLYLEQYGYKVYSQNDEDGIITEIFNRIGTKNKVFVEFGVQNGLECNSHYLLHKGWSGLWIEGSNDCCKMINKLFSVPIKNERLKVINAFIDKDNINTIISGFIDSTIDLLSIDIDGNDYWVWETISCIQPRVVVIEFNAKFPPDYEWVMKYNKDHIWEKDDNHGASLKSFELLGKKLGYQLVGTNFTGINAFFVRQEIAQNLFAIPATAENLYNPTRWDVRYISGHISKKYIGY